MSMLLQFPSRSAYLKVRSVLIHINSENYIWVARYRVIHKKRSIFREGLVLAIVRKKLIYEHVFNSEYLP